MHPRIPNKTKKKAKTRRTFYGQESRRRKKWHFQEFLPIFRYFDGTSMDPRLPTMDLYMAP